MASFRYTAVTPDGVKQSGTITAPTFTSARYELISRRLNVRSLRERKKFTDIEVTKSKAKPQDIANLSRQLSAFLKAGVPVIDALETIGEETKNKALKGVLSEMTAQLKAGDPFSDAVEAHQEHFPSYYPGIIRSAELSGRLDVVLDQLGDYIDRDLKTRRRVKSAILYPTILALMSIATVAIMVGFVLPRFATFFDEFDAELPLSTRMILALGNFFGKTGWLIAVVLILLSLLLILYLRTEPGKMTRDRIALRIPVIRELVRASVVERFSRILSAMVAAGVPISAAMSAAIDSTDNRVFNDALVEASKEMLEGQGLAAPISRTGLFPGTVTQMIRVGEETGTLDQQLHVAAEYYDKELTFKLDRLTSLFEPAVIIFMGVIVGFVALALVQAMYGVYGQSGIGNG